MNQHIVFQFRAIVCSKKQTSLNYSDRRSFISECSESRVFKRKCSESGVVGKTIGTLVDSEEFSIDGGSGGDGGNGQFRSGGGGGGGGGEGDDGDEMEFGPIMNFDAVMREAEKRGAILPADMVEAAKTTGIRKLLLSRYLDLQVKEDTTFTRLNVFDRNFIFIWIICWL